MEASDPRFEGTVTLTETVDTHGGLDLAIGALRIEDEGGAWQELPAFTLSPGAYREIGHTTDSVLIGEGGYDGLIAIVRSTHRPEADASSGVTIEPPDAPDLRLEGYVLNTTDLPEAPQPRSTTAE